MKTSAAIPGPARSPHTPERKKNEEAASKKQGDPRTPLPERDYKALYEALVPQHERALHELKLLRLVVSGARIRIPAALEHMGIDPETVAANPFFQNRNNPKGNQR